MNESISVIIPTLNEVTEIQLLVNYLKRIDFGNEILIVDGGSQDGTVDVIRKDPGVKLIDCERNGRGFQLAAGARHAAGNWLFFLHADCLPNKAGLHALEQLTHTDPMTAYCFPITFDQTRWPYPWLSWFSSMNLTLTTYGDQGLFISRQAYDQIGGYKAFPILEDVDIIRRIRKKMKIKKLPYPMKTSARRFEKNGIIRQLCKNVLILAAFTIGCSPNYLHKFYK